MTSNILEAIAVLTKPLAEPQARGALPSQHEALLAALRENRAALLGLLQTEKSYEVVLKLREVVIAEASWFSSSTEDTTWAFVQEGLLLLLILARHLSAELDLFHRAPPPSAAKRCTPEAALPLSPDVLSVSQERTLGGALQFVVSLGLCPYLAPGVGVPLARRSAFGTVVEKLVSQRTDSVAGRRLFTTTQVLLQFAELSSVATLVFTRHLCDIMAALCQLGYQPQAMKRGSMEDQTQELSAEERLTCKEALKRLIGKVYQPVVIKELLILQGGSKQSGAGGKPGGPSNRSALVPAPSWLRRLCGQLLSERLMQPRGVQSIVKAILEGGAGDESDWRKCDSLARILVTCPQQSASASGYYTHVCPQILDLLHFKDKLTARQFQRVATRTVHFMLETKPSVGQQNLLAPLLAPLDRCTTVSNKDDSQTSVEEWEITRCVEDIQKVWVAENSPSPSLLKALEGVLPVVFTLFCFTKQNVSHLRAPCQDILLWYLSHTETPEALTVVGQLSGLQGHESGAAAAAGFHFSPGSDGGVRLCSKESCSDEDDALYEKLSGEQWRLECLMQLLAQLKDSDVPGAFFLDLLQELTRWTAAEDEEQLNLSTMSLLEVEQQLQAQTAKRQQELAVLQVLAAMVETLHHSALLRKITQIVDFLLSLFQRACVGLNQATGPSLGNPVESQTLSMGIGLLASLLSGPQIGASDYSGMLKLLPSLETLSQQHSEEVIRELASSVGAVIATHGAYRPDGFAAAAHTRAQETQTKRDDSPADSRLSSPPSPRNGPNPTTQSTSVNASAASGMGAKDGSRSSSSSSNGGCQPPTPTRAVADLLLEACDPDVPTKAVALRSLTRLIQTRHPDAVEAQEKIFMLFLENLEQDDSFIYLSAIQGLAVLADSYPERILERLLQDFQRGPSLPTSNKERSIETRLKVGEVLMRASRAMGDLAPHLGRPLVGVFLQGTKDADQSVRASSLSNMGELCQRMNYALGPLAQELSSCLTALIKTEKQPEVRRAAVHVITLLLRGLSNRTTQVLSEVLLDLYRALKWVGRSDPDDVTVLHAQLALEELDGVMRRFIFPEQKLEKKIVVLP